VQLININGIFISNITAINSRFKKKETIVELLKEIKNVNQDSIIFLLIDNFPSHTSTLVKETAKELGIKLCFLPAYSPQLQPIEKYGIKEKEV